MSGKLVGRALERAEILIGGVKQSPEIMKTLEPFGYTKETVERMHTAFQTAAKLAGKRDDKYAAQIALTKRLKDAHADAEIHFNVIREQARVALANDLKGQNALKLDQPRPRTIGDFLHLARRFYQNAPGYLEKMERFGITRERLERETAAVNKVGELNVAQEAAKGEAQQATIDRNEAMGELRGYVQALEATAKEVYKDRNEVLVRLGMVQQGGRSSAYEDESEIWDGIFQGDDDGGDGGESEGSETSDPTNDSAAASESAQPATGTNGSGAASNGSNGSGAIGAAGGSAGGSGETRTAANGAPTNGGEIQGQASAGSRSRNEGTGEQREESSA